MSHRALHFPRDWMKIMMETAKRNKIFFIGYTKSKIDNTQFSYDSSKDEDIPPDMNWVGRKATSLNDTGISAQQNKFIQALPYCLGVAQRI